MATKAKTQQDVDQMSVKDRLWDSLSNVYGQKTEDSNKAYDQAMSQADRQLLSRGMQRSSYGAQTLANIGQQKIEAQNKIASEQIADYENRLYQIERDEKADEQWERQFAENVRQYDTTLAYNKERAAVADQQWQKSFDYQTERDKVADQQWQTTFNYQTERDKVADQQWQKAFDYQAGRDAVADQQWQKTYDLQLQQWQDQLSQWDQQFNYTKMSDEQKTAYNTVVGILANGNDPSDELLAKAGISRADANAMKAQVKASGGGSGSKSGSGSGGSNGTPTDADVESEFNPIPALNLADTVMNALNRPGLAYEVKAQQEAEKNKNQYPALTNKLTNLTKDALTKKRT